MFRPGPVPGRERSLSRTAAATLVLAAFYVAAGKIGLSLAAIHPSASAVWAPSGIAIGSLLLWGPRLWPGVFVGAFLVNVSTFGTVATSAAIATGNTLEAVAAALLVGRWAGGRRALESPGTLFRFVLLAGVVATTVSATVGVGALTLAGLAPTGEFLDVWTTWWLGDLAGALIVGPVLLAWGQPGTRPTSRAARLEAVAAGGATLLLGLLVFGGLTPSSRSNLALSFLTVPPILWAAYRSGIRASSLSVFLLSGVATWGTLGGFGPFGGEDPNTGLLALQSFAAVLGVVGLSVAAAVADQRRAEARLQDAHDELEQRVLDRTAALSAREGQLADAQVVAHVGSWDWDIAANRVSWSDELFRIYGMRPQEATVDYQSFLARVHPDEREQVDAIVQKAYADHAPFAFLHRIVRPDGAVRTLQAHGRVETDASGRPVRMLGTGQDVTELKAAEQAALAKAEELERSNRELQRFAYVASHDLQEPLRMVTSYVQFLEKRHGEGLPPEAHEFIGYAADGAARMKALIDDLLEYSRLQDRQPPPSAVEAEEALEVALGNLAPAVSEARGSITHESLPAVMADRGQLVQVFQNFLSNALKFRKKGEPAKIHVSARRVGDRWVFSVADQGIGIDPAYHERIFDLFQRLHTRAAYPGTGLGLSICRLIVERHGGTIRVASEEGKGATFYFDLGTVDAELAASAPPPAKGIPVRVGARERAPRPAALAGDPQAKA